MDKRNTVSSQIEKEMAQEGDIIKKHKGHLQYLFSSVYGVGSSKNTDLHLSLVCVVTCNFGRKSLLQKRLILSLVSIFDDHSSLFNTSHIIKK